MYEETKQYLDNFLAVTRTRPEERADREESAGDISDDELIVGPHNFIKEVKTRMGPQKQAAKERANMDEENVESSEPQARESTKEAFDIAFRLWDVPPLHGSLNQEDGLAM